jgi:LacI family transcriptional regulator, galactose operon repressor
MVAQVMRDPQGSSAKLKTKSIIINTARKFNYHSNLAAKALSTNKSYTIGILLPSTKNYYYADMVAVIQHYLSLTNYTPVFVFWEKDKKKLAAVEHILSRQVDAIITCEPEYLPDNLNIPVVSFHNFDKRFNFVGCNPQEVIKISLEYLVSLGHRRISYIGYTADVRSKEFVKLAPQYGIESSSIINLPYDDIDAGMEGLTEILRRDINPTAIMTHSDATAFGVMRRAWELNKKIPDDFSLMGFGNIRHASYCTPSLTSIGQSYDMESYIEVILKVVFDRLKDNSLPRQKYFCRPRLCIHESCKNLNS